MKHTSFFIGFLVLVVLVLLALFLVSKFQVVELEHGSSEVVVFPELTECQIRVMVESRYSASAVGKANGVGVLTYAETLQP